MPTQQVGSELVGQSRFCRLKVLTRIDQAAKSFRPPSQPQYYTTPVPHSVVYAGGDPEHIETVLPYLNHAANCGNSIIILEDLADPKRPLFIVCSLRTRFFPRGIWQAYLYANHYPDPLDYHLIGSLRLYFEPSQIPSWLTWRFLPRHLRARAATSTRRKLRKPSGLLIDPTLSTIALLHGEGG